jgi:hypothetical protein
MTPEELLAEVERRVLRGHEEAALELVERLVTFEYEAAMSRAQRTRLHELMHPIHGHLGLTGVTAVRERIASRQTRTA